jgi:hypothetical protein
LEVLEKERERGRDGGRGVGEQGQCQELTLSESQHQNVRKNPAQKKSSQEKSHIQDQGLMTGMSCLVDQGKMAQADSGPGIAFYRRGRVRKLVHGQESLVELELVLEGEFLF